jgi:xanthine dehydrogenase accessory factor
MERTKNIYPDVLSRVEQKQRIALATIIGTKGSTPQIPGASALFSEHGLLLGTLGGGIVEAAAQTKSIECLRNARSLIYDIKLEGGSVAAEEALCGGSVSILIDASPQDHTETFKLLTASLRARRAGLLATRIQMKPQERISLVRYWLEQPVEKKHIDNKELERFSEGVARAFRDGEPCLLREGPNKRKEANGLLFLEPLFPLPRLVIAGAGHIGRAVARLGKLLDFEVTVIDDRAEYASRERFPGADRIVVDDIGGAVENFPISSDTYVVIVTRGHSRDAEALRACIRSPAAYLGMIGSQRKIALMREKFIAEGWASAGEFDQVHAPIGLEIGSKTIEEIAVSIAAELVKVRSEGRVKKAAERA